MKLDILCSDGSPLNISCKTIQGDEWRIGLGGAELALLTMCEGWAEMGYEVCLYNDPKENNASPFEQRPIIAFDPNAKRDILIVFRSPNSRAVVSTGLKIWWSTDQHTRGSFANFASHVDKIVCISKFHAKYFRDTYGINGTLVIDLPVRLSEYSETEKVRNRFIFTSVPDRGLINLWRMWPVIKREYPDASLVITSDYRLWGTSDPGNTRFRAKWIVHEGITFLGAVPRWRLVEEEMKAEMFLYPSNYDELFCISAAEAQVAGAYPITSDTGSLPTTNMGTVIHADANNPHNDKTYVEATLNWLSDRDSLQVASKRIQQKAIKRFDPKRILQEWEEKVFNVA